jgi:hypothetical protein
VVFESMRYSNADIFNAFTEVMRVNALLPIAEYKKNIALFLFDNYLLLQNCKKVHLVAVMKLLGSLLMAKNTIFIIICLCKRNF